MIDTRVRTGIACIQPAAEAAGNPSICFILHQQSKQGAPTHMVRISRKKKGLNPQRSAAPVDRMRGRGVEQHHHQSQSQQTYVLQEST